MNIVIFKDINTEMLGIEINQKTVFSGKYQDFNAPKDIEKLLHEIQTADFSVKVSIIKASIEVE